MSVKHRQIQGIRYSYQMTYSGTLPALEDRFLPPANWQSGNFVNPETNHHIHYSFVLPDQKPKAIIVALPGLSEFGEKYIETARYFTKQGFGFYVIDWAYQGRSSRFKENTHKRSSDGYETDISDLHYLITNHIKTDSPLCMLGHSMGGNIGLRFLAEYPDLFSAASFSAPMLGIYDLRFFYPVVKIVFRFIKNFNSYVPGGKDWHEKARKSDGSDIFSSDPVRDKIHNAWCLANPELQIGNPTMLWLMESLRSIEFLSNRDILSKIDIPVLLTTAGKEKLVDNKAVKRAGRFIPNSKLLELKKSRHEILMERDEIRDRFIKETESLFNQSI